MNQKQLQKKHSKLLQEATDIVAEAYSIYYASVREFLNKTLTKNGKVDPQFTQMYVESGLESRRRQLEKALQEIADKKLGEGIELAFLFFYAANPDADMNKYNSYTVKQETVTLLMSTANNTEQRVKQVVKKVYQDKLLSDIAAEREKQGMAVSQRPSEVSSAQFNEQLDKEGFVGIVDKAGRHWKPDVYAKMVVRTKMMQAQIAMQQEQGRLNGIDLAYISGPHVDNPCEGWLGVIISMNGLTAGFATYDQARETGEVFHPNCQHYLIPLENGIADAPSWVISNTEYHYGMDLSDYTEITGPTL